MAKTAADAASVTEESEDMDFKEAFDPDVGRDWCELIKDIVAMSNTDGGIIIFGIKDDGTFSEVDVSHISSIDSAKITDKIHKYTEQQFSGFRLCEVIRQGRAVPVLEISTARVPMVFTAPGQYQPPEKESKTRISFAQGTVYFRHGAKSEPGNSEDLRRSIERELARVKDFWLQGITKVVEAKPGSIVQVVQTSDNVSTSGETSIRLTNNEDAPEFRVMDADKIYPYRQKELLKEFKDSFGAGVLGTYDLLLVRKHHGIDDNPAYSYKSQWGSRQYSEEFLRWLITQYEVDHSFFQNLRLIGK